MLALSDEGFLLDRVQNQLSVIRIRTDDRQVHSACNSIEMQLIAYFDFIDLKRRKEAVERLQSN